MKTITIFRGSPRRNGNTNSLTDAAAAVLRKAGCEVRKFDLARMDIRPCTACRECQKDWSGISCVQQDDFPEIADAVCGSDLMIFATPIYSWYCSAQMKALLDRLVYACNMYYGDSRGPSLWKGKSAALITTCGYPPAKGADLFEEGFCRYCKHSQLRYLGMLCEHHLGYDTVFMDEEKSGRAEAFANELLRTIC